jgi:hypothetical protein
MLDNLNQFFPCQFINRFAHPEKHHRNFFIAHLTPPEIELSFARAFIAFSISGCISAEYFPSSSNAVLCRSAPVRLRISQRIKQANRSAETANRSAGESVAKLLPAFATDHPQKCR